MEGGRTVWFSRARRTWEGAPRLVFLGGEWAVGGSLSARGLFV